MIKPRRCWSFHARGTLSSHQTHERFRKVPARLWCILAGAFLHSDTLTISVLGGAAFCFLWDVSYGPERAVGAREACTGPSPEM